jgi:hypothetical protein
MTFANKFHSDSYFIAISQNYILALDLISIVLSLDTFGCSPPYILDASVRHLVALFVSQVSGAKSLRKPD